MKKNIEFSRFQLYFLLQFIFIGLVMLYQLLWYFGGTTKADCSVTINDLNYNNAIINSGTLSYIYHVGNKAYTDYTTRNEIPLEQKEIEVKYLKFWPSMSRVNTFEDNWLGFIITYGVFFTFTSVFFLIDNDTVPNRSYFYFTRKKPWINIIIK
jgi:hypothetical protein